MKLAQNNTEHGKHFKNGYRKAFKAKAKARFKLCAGIVFRGRAYLRGVWNAFDFGGVLNVGVDKKTHLGVCLFGVNCG